MADAGVDHPPEGALPEHWERPLLSIVDPDLKELSWDRATLWFPDKVSIIPSGSHY